MAPWCSGYHYCTTGNKAKRLSSVNHTTITILHHGQFFPFTEATNMPTDFQNNFLRHKRNKAGLNSFLIHDFGGAIVFIPMNREINCKPTDVSEEDITSLFFGISKSTWWNVLLKLSLNEVGH